MNQMTDTGASIVHTEALKHQPRNNPEPGITLSINATSEQANSTVQASGYYQHPITTNELVAFGLATNGGNYFAAVYGGGNGPDELYYTQPTDCRWGDLYAHYPQVTPVVTTVSVQSATITEITSNPQIIATQQFVNSSSRPAEYDCGVTIDVATSVETNWSTTLSYDITQTVSYEMSFLGSGASGETSFSFSEEFGQGGSSSNTVTLGQNTGLEVTLDPHQSVTAELTVSQGTMNIEVVYQVTLAGGVFGTFDSPYTWPNYPSYGAHYIWWDTDINGMLNAGGAAQVLTVTETISVGFFTNSTVTLSDSTTGQVVRRVRGGETLGRAVPQLEAVDTP